MSRYDALALIKIGLLAAKACLRDEAQEYAEELLDAYLRDSAYRVDGIEVPVEFVTEALANL